MKSRFLHLYAMIRDRRICLERGRINGLHKTHRNILVKTERWVRMIETDISITKTHGNGFRNRTNLNGIGALRITKNGARGSASRMEPSVSIILQTKSGKCLKVLQK